MDIADTIKRLRLSLMIHSYIYYELDDNIISDSEWSARAMQLVQLQRDYPEIAEKVCLADLYRGFTGDTGFHLAKAIDDAGKGKARYLLMNRRKH